MEFVTYVWNTFGPFIGVCVGASHLHIELSSSSQDRHTAKSTASVCRNYGPKIPAWAAFCLEV